jgi:hypothetical protein
MVHLAAKALESNFLSLSLACYADPDYVGIKIK